jgi:hypothetical protein
MLRQAQVIVNVATDDSVFRQRALHTKRLVDALTATRTGTPSTVGSFAYTTAAPTAADRMIYAGDLIYTVPPARAPARAKLTKADGVGPLLDAASAHSIVGFTSFAQFPLALPPNVFVEPSADPRSPISIVDAADNGTHTTRARDALIRRIFRLSYRDLVWVGVALSQTEVGNTGVDAAGIAVQAGGALMVPNTSGERLLAGDYLVDEPPTWLTPNRTTVHTRLGRPNVRNLPALVRVTPADLKEKMIDAIAGVLFDLEPDGGPQAALPAPKKSTYVEATLGGAASGFALPHVDWIPADPDSDDPAHVFGAEFVNLVETLARRSVDAALRAAHDAAQIPLAMGVTIDDVVARTLTLTVPAAGGGGDVARNSIRHALAEMVDSDAGELEGAITPFARALATAHEQLAPKPRARVLVGGGPSDMIYVALRAGP